MLIDSIISWHVQMMSIYGFGVVILPMCVMLGQICGGGIYQKSALISCPTSNPKNPTRWNWQSQSIPYSYYHLLICSVDVIINGFGVVILPMCVILGQICGGCLTKISLDLPMLPSQKILPVDIHVHRSHQFHAHPLHHLLTCPDDVNQWLKFFTIWYSQSP
jgi:hypothetical protein